KTVKRLFAVSGNVCAFESCTTALVDEHGCVIGEICHICAQRPQGPRYDESQTPEQRHGFDNLILMCPIHHKQIDEHPATFTTAVLMNLKAAHEAGRESSTPVP